MGDGMKIDRILFTILGTMLPATALAHPGHGESIGSNNLLHYLAEPEHGIPIAVMALAMIAAKMAWGRSTRVQTVRAIRRAKRRPHDRA
jgi:hypothetical protein